MSRPTGGRKTRHKSIAPALPGAVCERYMRCGKAQCKCARGDLHGPYYVRRWRDGTRHHTAYVRPRDLAAVRQACARWRQGRYADLRDMRTAMRYSRMSAQELIAEIQKVEQWLQEHR